MPRFIPKMLLAVAVSTVTVQTASADASSTIRSLMSDISRSNDVTRHAPPTAIAGLRMQHSATQSFLRAILGDDGNVVRHNWSYPHSISRPLTPSQTLGFMFSHLEARPAFGNDHHNDGLRTPEFHRHLPDFGANRLFYSQNLRPWRFIIPYPYF